MGETATTSVTPGGDRVTDAGDGQHRADRHDRVGRGHHHDVGRGDGVEHPGGRAGAVGPGEADGGTGTAWWRCTKYSWKPISVPASRPGESGPGGSSAARVTIVRSGSSVTGSSGERRGPRPRRSRPVTSVRSAPSASRWVRYRWVPRSRSPRPNQLDAAVAFEHLHGLPGLARQAPAGLGVDGPGQGVGDGVEVGADVQAVQHEVVADVDHGGDAGRVRRPGPGRRACGPRRRRRRGW